MAWRHNSKEETKTVCNSDGLAVLTNMIFQLASAKMPIVLVADQNDVPRDMSAKGDVTQNFVVFVEKPHRPSVILDRFYRV